QIGATAKPCLGGKEKSGVHVHGRHVRVPHVGDQRNARGPESRVSVGAGNLAAELRPELAEHRGDVDAHLLEYAPLHHRHDATAAGGTSVVAARPRRAHEPARTLTIKRGRRVGFEALKRYADVVTQRLEPGFGARLTPFDLACVHFAYLGRRPGAISRLVAQSVSGKYVRTVFVVNTPSC